MLASTHFALLCSRLEIYISGLLRTSNRLIVSFSDLATLGVFEVFPGELSFVVILQTTKLNKKEITARLMSYMKIRVDKSPSMSDTVAI